MTIGTLDYPTLLQTFLPRPITTEEQYDTVIAQMNELIDLESPTVDEQDLLTLLGTLASAYEDEHYPDDAFELRGIPLIKALLAENGLRHKELLPIFKAESTISFIMSGKRKLTSRHIDELSVFFDLPHELFFEPNNGRFSHLPTAVTLASMKQNGRRLSA